MSIILIIIFCSVLWFIYTTQIFSSSHFHSIKMVVRKSFLSFGCFRYLENTEFNFLLTTHVKTNFPSTNFGIFSNFSLQDFDHLKTYFEKVTLSVSSNRNSHNLTVHLRPRRVTHPIELSRQHFLLFALIWIDGWPLTIASFFHGIKRYRYVDVAWSWRKQ